MEQIRPPSHCLRPRGSMLDRNPLNVPGVWGIAKSFGAGTFGQRETLAGVIFGQTKHSPVVFTSPRLSKILLDNQVPPAGARNLLWGSQNHES
ncbi:hypothetical protein E2320_006617 [Naja naja]|nr:hypothetical protein E2320_006617 [Naja naja]